MSNHIEADAGREKGKAVSWEGVRKGDVLKKKKGNIVSDVPQTLLIPTNTAALSNPAGADSHAGQTGDFPNNERSLDNIEN